MTTQLNIHHARSAGALKPPRRAPADIRRRRVAKTARHASPAQGRGDGPVGAIVSDERPWGEFQQLVTNDEVTVKVITVQPGHRLSLQRHQRRGELWRVLDGPIDVTLDEREWTAQPDEVIWIPQGAVHRMGNSGGVEGRVLEVAFGHFDEDDIHRLHDDYAR